MRCRGRICTTTGATTSRDASQMIAEDDDRKVAPSATPQMQINIR
jgi:hypothetical protein